MAALGGFNNKMLFPTNSKDNSKILRLAEIADAEMRENEGKMKYKIIIPGRPMPKDRPRFSRNGKKYLVYTTEATRKFERYVGYKALDVFRGKPLTREIAMNIKLYFKDNRFPDIDNCLKSLLDGLQGTAFENDRQVKRVSVERFQDENERAEIEIEEVG